MLDLVYGCTILTLTPFALALASELFSAVAHLVGSALPKADCGVDEGHPFRSSQSWASQSWATSH